MNKLFQPDLVKIVEKFDDKNDCLNYLTMQLADSGCLSFPDRFLAAVKGREEIMSTGIGRGVAIPHARDLTVSCLNIAVCMIREPLDFQAVDNLPVQLVFMIAVPQSSNKEYMKILRSLSEFLRQDENRNKLLTAITEMELFEYVHTIEDLINHNLAN
ncbi:MAG: PTS sugar transporter subunit IIA [Candidatus Cloacimonadaceae bacterium]|nr:PTS sugar transporter subunit IIA [Candidatus Cloacimonadaceae bacterium]